MRTPNYIKALLKPNGKKPSARRVWGIDLEFVWLPFFTATNAMGDTAIPSDALGCPIRLGYAQDGSVKFGKTGRPQTKVVKELSEGVRLIRENFTANLMSYASGVIAEHADAYKEQVKLAQDAGKPIIDRDSEALDRAMRESVEATIGSQPPADQPADQPAEPQGDKVLATA